jgi:dihydrofolate reductase
MHDGICVSAIAAVAQNGVVGLNGKLPWRIASDLKFFRRTTLRHAVIMGRKTLDEIESPLKRRFNIVLSRSLEREEPRLLVVRDLQQALAAAAEHERKQVAAGKVEQAEILVIGGPSIWQLAWPDVDRFYRTEVHRDFEGDVRFPAVDLAGFTETSRVVGEGDVPHTFTTLERIVSGRERGDSLG